jgi:hypothetical protein
MGTCLIGDALQQRGTLTGEEIVGSVISDFKSPFTIE